MTSRLGVVGVGAIAEAMVVGLCDGAGAPPPIVLSPRSRTRADSLAARYPSVEVAEHNQDVIDRSTTVLLCLRPQAAASVLRDLHFGSGHAVISVMAGVPMARLTGLVSPAEVLARAVPLPAVARRQGLTALCPAEARARQLFLELGDTLAATNESVLDALSAATATIAAHFAYLGAVGRWLDRQGVAEPDATRYVATLYRDIASTLDREAIDLAALSADHATPGGLNEHFLGSLTRAGFLELVGRSLDQVLDRLGDGSPGESV